MHKILGFDVSNNSCSVAVSFGDNILAYEEDLRPSRQAERLLVMIESALAKSNLSYRDIEYVALTNGPGSFTGIRIGLATAKGILLASNIKGLAVTNFDVLYYRATMQIKTFDRILVIINAYRNQSYIQSYNHLGESEAPLLINNQLLPKVITNYANNKRLICTGSGIAETFEEITKLDNITILPRFSIIKAIHICRLAQIKINSNLIRPIEPLYIRPPDAKAKNIIPDKVINL